jgi:hypothetical protein
MKTIAAADADRTRGSEIKWSVIFAAVLLLAFMGFRMMRSRPSRSSVFRLDSNGTARLGPVPLANTNLRNAVFTVVSHLNSRTASVSVAQSTSFSNLVETYRAMQRSGITSVTVRTTGPSGGGVPRE